MHTLFEGINQQVIGYVLHAISKIDSNVTVDTFNCELVIVFNSFIVQRHNCLLNVYLDVFLETECSASNDLWS